MKGLLLVALAALIAPPAAHAGDGKESKKDIVETAVAAGSFKTLATALTEAGLMQPRNVEGEGTVHGLRAHGRGVCEGPEGRS